MASRIDNIRISTIGFGVPVLLVGMLVVGLSASAVLLGFMGEVTANAVAAGSSTQMQAVISGLARLDGLLKGASALFALFLMTLAGFFYWFSRFRLLKPIIEMQTVMSRLAVGDNALEVPRQDQKDEIGAMARALEVFKRHAIELEGMSVIKSQKEQEIAHKRRMISLADALEGEIHGTVTEVVDKSSVMHMAAGEVSSAFVVVSERAQELSQASQDASANVEAMASATEELVAASCEIASQMGRTTGITHNAVGQARDADATMRELARVSQDIGAVLQIINDIAAQTNLLALNATIEAARAGDAGKGFAVVAGEVKTLATQTARAVGNISSQIANMRTASEHSVEAIQSIGSTIAEINEISAAVAAAIEQQQATIAEISRNAHAAADRTGVVTIAIGDITQQVENVGSLSARVEENSATVSSKLGVMENRLNAILRQSLQDAKTAKHDVVAEQGASLRVAGQVRSTRLREIGMDGALVEASDTGLTVESRVELLLPGFGPLSGRIVGREGAHLRLGFDMDSVHRARLGEYLFGHEAADQPYIGAARAAAATIAALFEDAVRRGELNMAQLFDETYQPMANTDPVQFATPFMAFTDRVLPAIQEPILTALPGVAFCVAADRNGYVPTHNARCSKPQGPDPVWNAANCRNRRVFDNSRELAAARNTQGYLLQSYLRDMGGGVVAILKDASAPIVVNGRHWGGLRIGYDI